MEIISGPRAASFVADLIERSEEELIVDFYHNSTINPKLWKEKRANTCLNLLFSKGYSFSIECLFVVGVEGRWPQLHYQGKPVDVEGLELVRKNGVGCSTKTLFAYLQDEIKKILSAEQFSDFMKEVVGPFWYFEESDPLMDKIALQISEFNNVIRRGQPRDSLKPADFTGRYSVMDAIEAHKEKFRLK